MNFMRSHGSVSFYLGDTGYRAAQPCLHKSTEEPRSTFFLSVPSWGQKREERAEAVRSQTWRRCADRHQWWAGSNPCLGPLYFLSSCFFLVFSTFLFISLQKWLAHSVFPPSFSLPFPFPSYAILLSLQVSMRSMLGKLLSCLFGLSSTRPLYLIRFIPSHCFLSHPYQLIMIRFSVEGKCPCYLFHSQRCNSLFDEKRITYSSFCFFTWCPTGFDSENVCYAQTLSPVKRFKMQALVGALITCPFQLVWSRSGC